MAGSLQAFPGGSASTCKGGHAVLQLHILEVTSQSHKRSCVPSPVRQAAEGSSPKAKVLQNFPSLEALLPPGSKDTSGSP